MIIMIYAKLKMWFLQDLTSLENSACICYLFLVHTIVNCYHGEVVKNHGPMLDKLAWCMSPTYLKLMIVDGNFSCHQLRLGQVSSIDMVLAFSAWGCEFESHQFQCSWENWVCLKFPWTKNLMLINCLVESRTKLEELIPAAMVDCGLKRV